MLGNGSCMIIAFLCNIHQATVEEEFLGRMHHDARLNDAFKQNWHLLASMGENLSKGQNLQCSAFRKLIFQEVWRNAKMYVDLFTSAPMGFDEEQKTHYRFSRHFGLQCGN